MWQCLRIGYVSQESNNVNKSTNGDDTRKQTDRRSASARLNLLPHGGNMQLFLWTISIDSRWNFTQGGAWHMVSFGNQTFGNGKSHGKSHMNEVLYVLMGESSGDFPNGWLPEGTTGGDWERGCPYFPFVPTGRPLTMPLNQQRVKWGRWYTK